MIPVIVGGVVVAAGGKKAYSYIKKRLQEKAEEKARKEAERKAEAERRAEEIRAEHERLLAEAKAKAEAKEREEREAIRKDVVHEMEKEQREKYNMALMVAAASGIKPTNPEEDSFTPILNEDDIEYEVNKRYRVLQEARAKEKKANALLESMYSEAKKNREESENLAKQLEEAREDLSETKRMAKNYRQEMLDKGRSYF